jgi:hypothetical protein|tara:strand:+ start:4108 stop:4965 length:858 start_codon:yes stop_codon:yes gene_type:complete
MSRGYIVIVQNNNQRDYLRLTYALALSMKATQRENAICVCVDEYTRKQIEPKHVSLFDHIVDIPWEDEAADVEWKINNKWKYIHMSPFDETIILDSDMLFTESVDHWWDHLTRKDVWLCSNVRTFKQELVTSDFYRKKFTTCKLPNVYSNFSYFNKSAVSFEYFKMVEKIMQNWESYYDAFLDGEGQNWISADVAYALAVKLLAAENVFMDTKMLEFPTFIHMKSGIQNISKIPYDDIWTDDISSELSDDLIMRIGNYTQTLPVHYVEKDWLTNNMIRKYESILL